MGLGIQVSFVTNSRSTSARIITNIMQYKGFHTTVGTVMELHHCWSIKATVIQIYLLPTVFRRYSDGIPTV